MSDKIKEMYERELEYIKEIYELKDIIAELQYELAMKGIK